jgi:hypothetical protein
MSRLWGDPVPLFGSAEVPPLNACTMGEKAQAGKVFSGKAFAGFPQNSAGSRKALALAAVGVADVFWHGLMTVDTKAMPGWNGALAQGLRHG